MFQSWKGKAAMAALTTPFTGNDIVDKKHFAAHAKQLIASGLDGVVPYGTTGEGASLSLSEKKKALEHLLGHGVEPDRVVVGVAVSAKTDAMEAALHALDARCRGVLLAPPYYYQDWSEEGLFRWFAEVIEAIGASARGIILYHIPSVTNVSLSVDLVNRLHKEFGDTIGAVKDSSGDLQTARDFLSRTKVPLLVGHEGLLAELMAEGAVGSISGLANIIPQRIAAVIHRGVQDPMFAPLVEAILKHPVVPAVKALLAHVAADESWNRSRLPLMPLSAEAARFIERSWEALVEGEVA